MHLHNKEELCSNLG